MLKRPGIALALALLLAGGCWLLQTPDAFAAQAYNGTSTAGEGRADGASNSAPQKVDPDTTVEDKAGGVLDQDAQKSLELALKTVNLSQGEGGIELWRLKAEWANMQKENGKIVVQLPRLTYFMPEKEKTLFVTSESGVIDQKEQVLSFIDNVHVSQEDKALQGDLLVYNGTAKTMTLPRGGEFSGTGISGSAAFIVWNINRKVIEAEGDVSVHFDGSESPAPLTPEQGS